MIPTDSEEYKSLVVALPENEKPAEADKQIKMKLKTSFFNDKTNGEVKLRGIIVADTEGIIKSKKVYKMTCPD